MVAHCCAVLLRIHASAMDDEYDRDTTSVGSSLLASRVVLRVRVRVATNRECVLYFGALVEVPGQVIMTRPRS